MIFPFAVIFIVIPLVDWLIGLDLANPDSDQEDKMKHQLWYTLLPVLVLPVQGFTLFWAAEIYHSAGIGGLRANSMDRLGGSGWQFGGHHIGP